MKKSLIFIFFILLLPYLQINASVANTGESYQESAPPDLSRWKDWIISGDKKYFCPPSSENPNLKFCSWVGILTFEIYENQIIFSQEVNLFKDGYIKLPGNRNTFPTEVEIDNNPVPVTIKEGFPVVSLKKGSWSLKGEFKFNTIPDFIPLPESTGGVKIINKSSLKKIFNEKNKTIWLKEKSDEKKADNTDSIRIKIFRKIKDSIPCSIETRIKLYVSGSKRQEKILPGYIPGLLTKISSDLPLRQNNDHSLTVQVKPGSWEIRLLNISPYKLNEIGPFNSDAKEEIIVHKNSTKTRRTKWKNITPIDPSQTDLPYDWKKYPSYLLSSDQKIIIKDIDLGIENRKDNLNLHRTIWVDFDGEGATIEDKITGFISKRKFIGTDIASGMTPGRISLRGKDQIISISSSKKGIVSESGNTNIKAVSRQEKNTSLFKKGWNLDFEKVTGVINLPPGWTFINISGAKTKGNKTFISKWTLMDLFILCLLAISASKLWNIKWGIIFFICAGSTFHNFYIPAYIWLFLIVSIAVFQNERIRSWAENHSLVKFIFLISYAVVILSIFSNGLKFSYKNIQKSIYPQLETYASDVYNFRDREKMIEPAVKKADKKSLSQKYRQKNDLAQSSYYMKKKAAPVYSSSVQNYGYSQTGPGIPQWQFGKINFYSAENKEIKLFILSPLFTRILNIMKTIFLWPLILRFIPFSKRKRFKELKIENILPFLLVLFIFSNIPELSASEFPPEYMIKEYKERLLKPDTCFPECATISSAWLNARKETGKIKVSLDLRINAQRDISIQLPVLSEGAKIKSIYMDKKEHPYIINHGERDWTYIKKGIHTLNLEIVSRQRELSIIFTSAPSDIKIKNENLEVSHIKTEDGEETIRISSLEKPGKEFVSSYKTEPFPKIRRSLHFGREWKIVTSIERFSEENLSMPLNVKIPLLQNEKILTEGISIKEGSMDITVKPYIRKYRVESEIPITEKLLIEFPENLMESQTWSITGDPVWNFKFKNKRKEKIYNISSFRLRPSDKIWLQVKKLSQAKGKFMSVDKLDMTYDISKSSSTLKIEEKVRSSKGDIQIFSFDKSRLSPFTIKVNGIQQPVTPTNGKLSIQLNPGTNNIKISFHDNQNRKYGFISFPSIKTNTQCANITQRIKYNIKSWLISAHGPMTGPAVLFWGYLIAVLAASIFISRLPIKSNLAIYQWVLFSTGLATMTPLALIICWGWFFAIEYRKNNQPKSTTLFNLMQTGLVLLTIAASMILYHAISNGLLGIPDMHIKGNSSYHTFLSWFTDKADVNLPKPGIVISHLFIWKTIIFAWAIWLASFLMGIVPNAMEAFRTGGIWKKINWKLKPEKK